MDGLSFVTATPPIESDPARADIACFIGFAALREGDLSAERRRLKAALERLGWTGPDLPAGERLIPDDVTPAADSERAFIHWLKHAGWQPGTGAGNPPRRAVPEAQLFRELLRVWFPSAVVDWWSDADYLNSANQIPAVDLLDVRDVPLHLDTWDVFDVLFAWDARPLTESSGAAIPRSAPRCAASSRKAVGSAMLSDSAIHGRCSRRRISAASLNPRICRGLHCHRLPIARRGEESATCLGSRTCHSSVCPICRTFLG
jgi:hypothetical protein